MIQAHILNEIAQAFEYPIPKSGECRWIVRNISVRDADHGFANVPCNCTRTDTTPPNVIRLTDHTVTENATISRPGRPPRLRFHRFRVGQCDQCRNVFCFALPPITQR